MRRPIGHTAPRPPSGSSKPSTGPELADGPVVFTDYVLIATNRGQ